MLKFIMAGLLLVLAVALGTEVAALHRLAPPQTAGPVVVRKATHRPAPIKIVRPVPPHPHKKALGR